MRTYIAREAGHPLIEFVLERIPQTETYHQLQKALLVPLTSV
jgi:hypothetical protein